MARYLILLWLNSVDRKGRRLDASKPEDYSDNPGCEVIAGAKKMRVAFIGLGVMGGSVGDILAGAATTLRSTDVPFNSG